MTDLAHSLIRTVVRAFYQTEHIIAIDALVLHSTLQDSDLAQLLGVQTKGLHKTIGRLREDGLVTVQNRAERRTDGTGGYYGGAPQAGKERVTHRQWYYLNFHRAIDSIKYRMYRLNKHIESLGMPTTERKDLSCPRCKSQYAEIDVMDNISPTTGEFLCHMCGHVLDPVEEDELANENQSMKRLNNQLEKLLKLMQKIDATDVPENDFEMALSKMKPIQKSDTNPGSRTEIVDLPNRNLQSTKGLVLQPERIAVEVQDDEDVKRESKAAEAEARKAAEARQNALPDWISKSTITGDITAVGAKEERLRKEREQHAAVIKDEDNEEKKPSAAGDEDVMAAYWDELARAREKEAQEAKEEEEEDDDDEEDEFEDVDVGGTPPLNGKTASTTGFNTPANVESSNATDDERETKRVRIEEPSSKDTPAASDADDDELEFQDV
ncbi:unnamed protein product [Zymoseptoria tritici ST99CH_1A5]|uniref:HTH TFE/IIEalpha-type domain-containing protein n=1 Tax=Zymoseptoria tritici ST99CH_1A5 TaxID=1276529 RepID=A0A1Y6LE13_ZYMTR|nr:unnamed protein product [Zymoseptoria tritici ST99CH_1A5]